MIPPIIHQFWVGSYAMPKRERRFVEDVKHKHPWCEHRLWTDRNLPVGSFPPHIAERYFWRMGRKDYAFAVDIAKVVMVWLQGGIYLDVDTETHEGLAPIRDNLTAIDGIFRHHQDSDPTFSTDFAGMPAGHPIGEYLLNSMRPPAYDFGPHWLGYSVKRWLGVDKDAKHSVTRGALAARNMMIMPSGQEEAKLAGLKAWNDLFQNHALYSWSPENRERFERGLMT